MNTIFHTGVTGMHAYQNKLDSTANNMANINTAGYKPDEMRFEALLYTNMDVNSQDILNGHGVKHAYNALKLNEGSFIKTDNPLDFAIKGEGFFAVDKAGKKEYTRNGAFKVELERNHANIVTSDGSYVLDRRGMPLTLSLNSGTGQPDYSSLIDSIGVFTFSNPYQLVRTASGRFESSEESGPPVVTGYQTGSNSDAILQGYYETSSVSLGNEMAELLKAQRAFQVSARIVQTADEIEQTVNNLR